MLEFNVLLRVGMSTYYGNLDDSEGASYWMQQDLEDIQDENKMVKCKMLDGSEILRPAKDIEDDFSIDWNLFSQDIVERCESDIDGSVRQASDGKFEDMADLLKAYWFEYKGYEWFMPKYYNYDNDSLDLCFELTDMEWSLEKYWLTELVQKYIDEVRVESYDGYCSFEPSKIEDVEWNDYCVMWAILQKEWVFDYIQSELQELIDYNGFEIYNNAVDDRHYEYREDNNPEWTEFVDLSKIKRYYFILHYDEKYLEEVPYEYLYPKKDWNE